MSEAARPRLVVHVGDHKTGTTSIQAALAAGRVRLAAGDLLYPLGETVNHNYLCRRGPDGVRPERADTPKGPGLDAIAARIAAERPALAILSAEQLEGAPPAETAALLQEVFGGVAELRVVAYVRPHAARVLSSFAEHTKIGLWDGTPDEFAARQIRRGAYLYHPRFAAWRAALGDRFVLRPMIRARLAGGGAVEDFLTVAAGPPPAWTLAPGETANESLSLEDLMLLQALYRRLPAERAFRHAFGWEVARLAGRAGGGGTRLRLHRALAERIAGACRDDAAAMDAAFFGGEAVLAAALEAAVAEAPEAPQIPDDGGFFPPEEARRIDILARLIRGMLPNRAGPWPPFWRRRAADRVRRGAAPDGAGEGADEG